jgi:hypothetical protein
VRGIAEVELDLFPDATPPESNEEATRRRLALG